MKEGDITSDPVVILRELAEKGPNGESGGILSVRLNGREYVIHPEDPIVDSVPTALGRIPQQLDTGFRIAQELDMPFALIELRDENAPN